MCDWGLLAKKGLYLKHQIIWTSINIAHAKLIL